jgi:hypothetical protein
VDLGGDYPIFHLLHSHPHGFLQPVGYRRKSLLPPGSATVSSFKVIKVSGTSGFPRIPFKLTRFAYTSIM